MITTLTKPIITEEIFNLDGISRGTYTNLWQDLSNNRCLKLTYYYGNLEIISPSPEREYYKEVIERFTRADCSPISICEANAFGLPVIISKQCGRYSRF